MPIYLNNVVGDPKRRAAAAKIRPHRDHLVYVEGESDADLMRLLVRKPGIRFQAVPQQNGFIGKDAIINLVSNHAKNSFGIVDMDHDFSSHTIQNVPNIHDTSSKCCLQALILEEKAYITFIPYLSKRLFPKQKQLAIEFEEKLQANWLFLAMVAKSRTSARLFRGKNGRRKGYFLGTVDRNAWPSMKVIIDEGKDCFRDLIPQQYLSDYNDFLKRYHLRLKSIGINDHSLEEVLGSFILYFKEFKKHIIRREIGKAVLEYTAREVDSKIVLSLIQHIP